MIQKKSRRDRRVPGQGMTMTVGTAVLPVVEISMSGCRTGTLDVPAGEKLRAALSLPLAVGDRTIEVMCTVMSHDESGTVIRFASGDYRSLMSIYMHLLRFDREEMLVDA